MQFYFEVCQWQYPLKPPKHLACAALCTEITNHAKLMTKNECSLLMIGFSTHLPAQFKDSLRFSNSTFSRHFEPLMVASPQHYLK